MPRAPVALRAPASASGEAKEKNGRKPLALAQAQANFRLKPLTLEC